MPRRGGVCLVFALRSFCVRGRTRALYGRATDRQRTSDRRQTGGHSSDADILRHSEMGGGARWVDLPRTETDTPRATHGRFPYGRTTGGRRTGNGHQTGGGRAGIRLLPTFCDIPRWAAAWRTWDGLLTGGRWAAHGLETGGTRTIPPTGGQRASDGRATDCGRGATATDF